MSYNSFIYHFPSRKGGASRKVIMQILQLFPARHDSFSSCAPESEAPLGRRKLASAIAITSFYTLCPVDCVLAICRFCPGRPNNTSRRRRRGCVLCLDRPLLTVQKINATPVFDKSLMNSRCRRPP